MKYVNKPLIYGREYNTPKLIVLHAMGEWIIIDETQAKWFKDNDYDIPAGVYHCTEFLLRRRLSAHVLVSPSILIRCREDHQGAWHAGKDNKNSLGIEFCVPGVWHYNDFTVLMKSEQEWLTEQQYEIGLDQLNNWLVKYNLTPDVVDTHARLDPTRKCDPGGGFPLKRFKSELIII